MSTGSRIALGIAVGLVAAIIVAAALVVVAVGASGAEPTGDPAERTVTMTWTHPDDVLVPPLEDRLAPTTVLTVRIEGFPADTTGTVAQCVVDERRRCTATVPVRTDESGSAVFQYLVTDAVDPDGRCRLSSSRRCTVEVVVGDRRSEFDTVFVDDAPPPGRVTIEPAGALTIGDTVTIGVDGLPAGTEVVLEVCAVPATRGTRCGRPGPVATVITDQAGSARTTLALDVEAVGEAGVACGRRTACQVVARSSTVGARATPAVLGLATQPGATYDGGRVTAGLALAALLGIGAARIVRTTEWGPPAEADASAIDDAAWADLDAEADAFEANEAG